MARMDAGLNQEELAALLAERYGVKVGRSYISELERNWESNKMPMADVCAALARALGVNGNWLLLIDDNPDLPEPDGGHGMVRIAADLTRDGVPAPMGGGVWRKNSVAVILGRAWTYAGYSEFYRDDPARYIRAAGTWNPLWDDDTAERIEQERRARAANRRIADTPSRLTGIVICETCGRTMWEIRNENRDRREKYLDVRRRTPRLRYARFYCYPYHVGGSVSTARVLQSLALALADLAATDLSAVPDDDADRAAELQQQIDTHAAAIQRHMAALRRADTAYVSGAMDDERYGEQVKRLRAAIEQEQSAQTQLRAAADAERQRGSRGERLAAIRAAGPAMLTTPDTAAANAWLRRYVRVFVRDNSVVEVRFL